MVRTDGPLLERSSATWRILTETPALCPNPLAQLQLSQVHAAVRFVLAVMEKSITSKSAQSGSPVLIAALGPAGGRGCPPDRPENPGSKEQQQNGFKRERCSPRPDHQERILSGSNAGPRIPDGSRVGSDGVLRPVYRLAGDRVHQLRTPQRRRISRNPQSGRNRCSPRLSPPARRPSWLAA